VALEMIRELYLIERAPWDRHQPISAEHRVRADDYLFPRGAAAMPPRISRWFNDCSSIESPDVS
jgi:hypothetical protein